VFFYCFLLLALVFYRFLGATKPHHPPPMQQTHHETCQRWHALVTRGEHCRHAYRLVSLGFGHPLRLEPPRQNFPRSTLCCGYCWRNGHGCAFRRRYSAQTLKPQKANMNTMTPLHQERLANDTVSVCTVVVVVLTGSKEISQRQPCLFCGSSC